MGKVIRIKNDVYLANDVYREQETIIGKWIDDKNIYRKVISLGTLPNQSTIQKSSGLNPSIVRIVKIYGYCVKTSVNETFPLPFVWGNTDSATTYVGMFFGGTDNSGNIWLRTNRDMSDYIGYVILEYTKTTD